MWDVILSAGPSIRVSDAEFDRLLAAYDAKERMTTVHDIEGKVAYVAPSGLVSMQRCTAAA